MGHFIGNTQGDTRSLEHVSFAWESLNPKRVKFKGWSAPE